MRHAALCVCVCVCVPCCAQEKKNMLEPICVCVFLFFACSKRMQARTQVAFTWAEAKKSDRERKFEERRPGLEKQKSSKNGIHPRTLQKSLSARFAVLAPLVVRIESTRRRRKRISLAGKRGSSPHACVRVCDLLEIFPQDVRTKQTSGRKQAATQARIRGPESAKGFHGTRCTYACGWAHEQAHARAWPRDARGWAFFDFSGQRGRNGEQTLDSMAAVQSGMHEKPKGSVHGAGQALSARARLGGAGSAKAGIGQDARPVQCGEADFECPLGRS